MHLEVTPEHLPVIAAQLNLGTAALADTVTGGIPAAVPLSPGADDVSAMIPIAFGQHAQLLFPALSHGMTEGTAGSGALPVVGAMYTSGDVTGGGTVMSTQV